MKVIIAGTRTYKDYSTLKRVCEDILSKIQYERSLSKADFEIVSGKAKGADELGEKFARENGIKIKEFPAQWDNMNVKKVFVKRNAAGKPYNALAGSNRNQEMIDYVAPDGIAIFFWDGESVGTKGTVSLKQKRLEFCIIL